MPGTRGGFNLSTPWVSNHEVLFYDGSQGSLVDVNTNAKRPLPGFRSYGEMFMGAMQASPDGKWLLWATGTANQPLWAATEMATGRSVQRPRQKPADQYVGPSFVWLSDSRRWTEDGMEKGQPCTFVYSVDKPGVSRVPLGQPGTTSPQRNTPSFPVSSGLTSSLQVTDQVVSPDGRRTAWFSSTDNNSINWSYLIGCLIRLGHIPSNPIPRHWVGLWVSRSDGSDAHQIVPDFSCTATPVCLQWSPDSKHLSFYYAFDGQDTLWKVPVLF